MEYKLFFSARDMLAGWYYFGPFHLIEQLLFIHHGFCNLNKKNFILLFLLYRKDISNLFCKLRDVWNVLYRSIITSPVLKIMYDTATLLHFILQKTLFVFDVLFMSTISQPVLKIADYSTHQLTFLL